MKRYCCLVFALVLFLSTGVVAQSRTLKKVMELRMPKTADDDFCGTRGASVCWNPVTKKYYAAFAGNTRFPMAVFDPTGKRISKDSLTTMEDIRGLWYDPVLKKIMANGYDDIGWINYELNKAGIPTHYYYQYQGMNQPNAQSVGSYDVARKKVLFLDGNRVLMYQATQNMFADVKDSLEIQWGRKTSEGPNPEDPDPDVTAQYNTSVVATNIPNRELGFLNIESKQIELYSFKGGYLQSMLKLPDGAPVESIFNFAYSNGLFWLFDIKNRKWIGYK